MKAICTFLLFLILSQPAIAQGYVANVNGVEGKYRIFEFTEKGNPYRPISDGTLAGVAWPSAVKIGSAVHVYASSLTSGGWTDIRRWTSSGGAYVDQGVVFSADTTEPYGIGPATVTYDASTWRIFYLVRGSAGPGTQVKLATSTDGVNFTRVGVVYTAGSEAPDGLSVSYACSDNGHHLFLHAYASGQGKSIVASSSSPDTSHSYAGTILQPNGQTGTLTGQQGNSFAQFTGSMTIGVPIVVGGEPVETYFPKEIVGNSVYLDRPLEASLSAAPFADIFRNNIDLSFVRKINGAWTGAATGYGQFPSVLSEFTAPISAAALLGSWSLGSGYAVNPYFNSGQFSTENPEPIRTDSGC